MPCHNPTYDTPKKKNKSILSFQWKKNRNERRKNEAYSNPRRSVQCTCINV